MRPYWLNTVTLSLVLMLQGCNSGSRSNDNNNPPPADDTQEPPPEEVQLPEPIYSPETDEAVIFYKRNDHFDGLRNTASSTPARPTCPAPAPASAPASALLPIACVMVCMVSAL